MGNCYCCNIINGGGVGFQAKEYVVELEGGWVLNHCGGDSTYLGYLILQTKRHRSEFHELTSEEASCLGRNMQHINLSLRHYWSVKYSDDPVERVYAAYLNETPYFKHLTGEALLEESHIHFHLLTRTRNVAKNLVDCPDTLGWNLLKNIEKFPSYLRGNDDDKINLMKYLKESLGM